jgi:hypothetical protein
MTTPDLITRFNTIILVGDNSLDNGTHQRLLESMNIAKKFMVFSDPLEAIDYLKLIPKNSKPPNNTDLIILELTIPVMDAWYFIGLFKMVCTVSHPNAKIIIIADSFNEHDIERMNSEKLVSCFIKKPLTYDKIMGCFKNSSAINKTSS